MLSASLNKTFLSLSSQVGFNQIGSLCMCVLQSMSDNDIATDNIMQLLSHTPQTIDNSIQRS